ncbi:Thiol-disulfide isomerase or thioredoxin [Pseudomonas flavescens]|uniref:Thiol-disulfide isomerase or thioredoxin n=1 Tax=Phytopseudomonas flavescens TaxID=29435 RepID=A0A1G8JCI3_9GAMM|nr:TlpA disulfide reductase family protein [Pseudomonas flavescens]SDI28697.1 Thiol-disulfide isomerase or thioredoxin [Pseudomonas flavescens]
MVKRFQAVIRTVVMLVAGLALVGCGDDFGVDQHARKVAAERLEGQWLIINYWAEWCGPCRSEIPELNALAPQLEKQSAGVFGVNFDGLQGDELARAAEALGIEFTVLAKDPAEHYGLPPSDALPVTYIVDDKGRVRERLLGEQNAEGLKARLSALRQEG